MPKIPRYKENILSIFIDSESLESELLQSGEHAKSLLLCQSTAMFIFIRTPFKTENPELKDITAFEKEFDEINGNIKALVIRSSRNGEETTKRILFDYNDEEVEQLGKHIFNRSSLTEYYKESIRLVLMCIELFRGHSKKDITLFVTCNKALLRNRQKIEVSFPSKLNILTVEEAMERMDLFAKSQGEYFTRPPHATATKGLWYWESFRSKIPHYHVPGRGIFEPRPILEAFASRFTYLLLCIDEIGIEYYYPDDADIMIPYHFNYFLPLVTGIFDNLAIAAREKYSLRFKGDRYPNRTSLFGATGEDFLKELKEHNPSLRHHRDQYLEFINLIYKLRELATHRQGFRSMGYKRQGTFKNPFVIDNKTVQLIKNCGDRTSSKEQISDWGVLKDHTFLLLEPYHFAKSAGLMLIEFADEYLRLLGFERYDDSEIRMFEKYSLDAGKWGL